MLGSWTRLSFEMNDIYINSARQMSETKITQQTNDEYDLFPLEIYSQLVNGTNYKLLFAARHFKDKSNIKLFTSTVYKPLGDQPQLSLGDVATIDCSNNAFNDTGKEIKISTAVSSYLGVNGIFKVQKFFNDVLGQGTSNVYCVNTDKGTAVVYESGEEFKVDALIN